MAAPLYQFFVPDAGTMRDDWLRTVRNGLIQRGVPNPNVTPGSDYYVMAQGFANEAAVAMANCVLKADELMPDTATGTALDRIAASVGLSRRAAAGSIGPAIFSASAASVVTTGSQLIDSTGLRYAVTTGGTYSNGDTIPVAAVDTGAATNLAAGSSLRWQSPPAFASTTMLVGTGGLTNGTDADDDESFRGRLYGRLQTFPAGGNWQYVAQVAEGSSSSVQKSFVYPAIQGPATLHVAVVASPTSTNKNRDVAASTVTGVVSPFVQGQLPEHAFSVITTVANVGADVSIGLSLPAATTASPAGPRRRLVGRHAVAHPRDAWLYVRHVRHEHDGLRGQRGHVTDRRCQPYRVAQPDELDAVHGSRDGRERLFGRIHDYDRHTVRRYRNRKLHLSAVAEPTYLRVCPGELVCASRAWREELERKRADSRVSPPDAQCRLAILDRYDAAQGDDQCGDGDRRCIVLLQIRQRRGREHPRVVLAADASSSGFCLERPQHLRPSQHRLVPHLMPLPDIDDYTATFGGSKTNAFPVEDSTTDEDAAVRNQYVADVAMMSATVPRGIVTFTAAATTGAMVLVQHIANWGTGAGVAPTLSRSATGVYVVSWPSTVTDALGVTHSLNIRYAMINVRGTGTAYDYYCNPTSANAVTVYAFNASGTALDLTGINIDIVIY
jgi:uncharacterized phage protein gp47/JayE